MGLILRGCYFNSFDPLTEDNHNHCWSGGIFGKCFPLGPLQGALSCCPCSANCIFYHRQLLPRQRDLITWWQNLYSSLGKLGAPNRKSANYNHIFSDDLHRPWKGLNQGFVPTRMILSGSRSSGCLFSLPVNVPLSPHCYLDLSCNPLLILPFDQLYFVFPPWDCFLP